MHAVYAYAGSSKNNQTITFPLSVSGGGKSGAINYNASGSVLKTETKLSAQANTQKIGVEAKAGATLVEAKASVGVGPVSWNTALAQGKAEIGGKAEINFKDANFGFNGKVGAYLIDWKNTIGVKIGGVSVEVGGSLNAGRGGEFKVEAGKNGIKFKLGGTLGIGGAAIIDIRW
ncbi:hypothetical protein COB47_0496 [Caldicellulosiruptor obsidiansis OB47]|uniref:Uncharacterized protein n=1 Tax=Caldicellulosiruptor obsidiansis (strain ATCC BAA-2073 / JCM 16842 / OB47) TaxID=608506 RepID=D9TII6_CALOO|nr:hypothetical protein [Caldicellulosiruptor obsidiansis]ADL41818.1 hypothetical protein COB47_0496 [Caldicellulosiruptor obsidiansis OB47]